MNTVFLGFFLLKNVSICINSCAALFDRREQ